MTRNVKIVPALLSDDIHALRDMIQLVEGFAPYLQLDIMDGKFVPSNSITLEQLPDIPINMAWEAHLMVHNTERYLKGFKKAGTRKIVFHFESTKTPEKTIAAIRATGLEVGLAVNPNTTLADFDSLVNKVDSVLFLSVNPGFYGSPFVPEVLDKIKDFRINYPEIETAIDGGVKENNIAEISKLGVDTICVGSAILLHPQPAKSYQHLLDLAQQNSPLK